MIYTSRTELCGRRRLWTWSVCDPESGGVDYRLTLAAAVHLSGFMVHDAVFHHKVIHDECHRTRGLFGGNRGLFMYDLTVAALQTDTTRVLTYRQPVDSLL